MEFDFGINQGFVEEQFLLYQGNPGSVDPSWRRFFENLERERDSATGGNGAQVRSSEPVGAPSSAAVAKKHGNGNGNGRSTPMLPPTAEYVPQQTATGLAQASLSADALLVSELQGRVSALVNAYRVRGHIYADLDPLNRNPPVPTELSLAAFGLDQVDPNTVFFTGDMAGPTTLPLHEIVARLKETYCRTIGVEFTHIEDPEERQWLQRRMESTHNRTELTHEEQLRAPHQADRRRDLRAVPAHEVRRAPSASRSRAPRA